ncbi:MAG TPA: hypothetical protein VE959_30380 [Bryobacteraceae bacterium]|nr:hypothetical protein [Bryobacteraceae bacterium]
MTPKPRQTDVTDQLLFSLRTYLAALTGPEPPPQASAQGAYDTILAAMLVDAKTVADALPAGLTLQPDAHTPPGQHPVLITMGVESHVDVVGLSGELNYGETIIAVPNVAVDGHPASNLADYVTRIDVNDAVALVLGLAIGLPKVLSMIVAGTSNYSLFTLLSRGLILQAASQPTTPWKTPADFPKFAYVQSLLQQPIVSVDAGNFLFSEYNWDFVHAQLQGTTVHLKVEEDLPALPGGEYHFPGFDSEVIAAGRFRANWKVAGPFLGWPPPYI